MEFQTPRIITRKQWGAIEPPKSKPYFLQIPTSIVIHHFGFPADNPNCRTSEHFKGEKTIRKLQSRAINRLGLIDIEYHYIIAPDGVIYKGRPVTAVGKHCSGKCNNSSVGIMCYGNYNVEKVPAEVRISLVYILRNLVDIFNINPQNIYGHRDKDFTSCPGIYMYSFIERIKNRCQF
jgi:N-acetyl-anhydromuramyl-L-alanine amidase AmpD